MYLSINQINLSFTAVFLLFIRTKNQLIISFSLFFPQPPQYLCPTANLEPQCVQNFATDPRNVSLISLTVISRWTET
jgi:hypothetical protein